jgi:hypothetical protein
MFATVVIIAAILQFTDANEVKTHDGDLAWGAEGVFADLVIGLATTR